MADWFETFVIFFCWEILLCKLPSSPIEWRMGVDWKEEILMCFWWRADWLENYFVGWEFDFGCLLWRWPNRVKSKFDFLGWCGQIWVVFVERSFGCVILDMAEYGLLFLRRLLYEKLLCFWRAEWVPWWRNFIWVELCNFVKLGMSINRREGEVGVFCGRLGVCYGQLMILVSWGFMKKESKLLIRFEPMTYDLIT